jgi:GTP-binding protein
MPVPVVAIVGRPNVGKSSLLNRLAGRRISIVDPTPGVTRDRVGFLLEYEGRWIELVDTGGHGITDSQGLTADVERQIDHALEAADLVLFVVDARDGILPLDTQMADKLRRLEKPVIPVANKADLVALEGFAGEFLRLGLGEPTIVSAEQGVGRRELLDRILRTLGDKAAADKPAEPVMKLAVVGKRNAGKSTLINALAGSERVIVGEVPGTTRDSVDVRFGRDGRTFIAIDTAGVRKTAKMADSVEFYSFARAQRAIRRADVCVLLIDAAEKVGLLDKQISQYIAEQVKPCIVCINKWDLVGDKAGTDDYAEYIGRVMPWLDYAPLSFISARNAEHIGELVDLALELHGQAGVRVSTADLNRAVEQALAEKTPSVKRGVRLPKIYYATQIEVRPPTIVLFVNDPELIDENYRRFLTGRFRQLLPFAEIPLRLHVRSRREGGRGRSPHGRADEAPAEAAAGEADAE